MKIYRIHSAFTEKGNFIYKQASHKEGCYSEIKRQMNSGASLTMEWAWGCKTKKIADFIPSTSPGKLFTKRAMDLLSPLILSSQRYQVNLSDGNDSFTFYGVVVKGYTLGEANMDHLLSLHPKHGYPVVSEEFKKAWEENGFTGMEFEEVDEIDDYLFLKV